jgi:spore germination cell wall hydrolase CwlJ-like protein|tara:strand:+ start:1992 stop:3698 length:1707 start_codon:yes stop_codon:yes gene_type:complete
MLKNIFKFKNLSKKISPSKGGAMNFVSGNNDSETSASGARVRPKTPKASIINNLSKLDSNQSNAFDFLDFFGRKRTELRLRNSIKRLRNSLVTTFDIAALLKSIINGIFKKLEKIKDLKGGRGGGGLFGALFGILKNLIGNFGSTLLGWLGGILRMIPGLGGLVLPGLLIGGTLFAAGAVLPKMFPGLTTTETDADVDQNIEEQGGQATADALRQEQAEKKANRNFLENFLYGTVMGEDAEYEQQIRRAEESAAATGVETSGGMATFREDNEENAALQRSFANNGSVTSTTPLLPGMKGRLPTTPDMESDEQEMLLKLMVAEAGGEGELGMAAVGRSVMNRAGLIQSGEVGSGTFMSKSGSVSDVITARKQYQPVVNGQVMQDGGTTNRELTPQERQRALRALELAKNTEALKERFRAQGMSESQVRNMMGATGFRTHNAYYDQSQEVNVTEMGGHRFNTAGNQKLTIPEVKIDVSQQQIEQSSVQPQQRQEVSSAQVPMVDTAPSESGNITFLPLPIGEQQQQSSDPSLLPTSAPGGGSPTIAFYSPSNPDSYGGLSTKLIYSIVDA